MTAFWEAKSSVIPKTDAYRRRAHLLPHLRSSFALHRSCWISRLEAQIARHLNASASICLLLDPRDLCL